MKDSLIIAEKFADSLDRDDFVSAQNFLDFSCEYIVNDKVFKGSESILNSYKEHSEFAKSTFDQVVYEILVKQNSENEFEITYKDIISKNKKTHTYSCKQIISLNELNKIKKITHVDIPGEYEQLKVFYSQIGLS